MLTRLFALLVALVLIAPVPRAGAAIFISDARIADLKTRIAQKTEPTYTAFLKLQKEADASLNRQPQVPQNWYVPGFYKDPAGHNKAKGALANDANAAYGLALMYRLTGDEKYGTAAIRLIDGWAAGLKTTSQKDDSMLSFSYHFPALIFAAGLLKNDASWPADQQQAFRDFVRTKALPMNTMARENNWGNWGLVLVLASASLLDDHALFDRGVERWKHFIDTQIAEDGHLPLEVIRNGGKGEHGIWYSNFSLMPQTLAAEIARVNGVDLFDYQSPKGRTLRQAYERLVPWVADPTTFPYYHGDPTKLFATDYISYWEILQAHWPNAQATALLSARRPMSATHSAPDLTLTHGDLLKD